jgi:hypothetical protein
MPIAADFKRSPEIASVPVNWSHEQIDRKFGETDNVGLILGPRSGDLVEVDFHWQEAGAWALELMQDLPAFCRDGAGFVNRFARARLRTGLVQFKIPEGLSHIFGADRRIVLELKGDGYQALVPPSLHPSGERLRWRLGYLALKYADDIPYVSPEWLIAKAGLLAAMAVLGRAYPRYHGNRDNILREITGMLVHSGCEIHLVSDFLDQLFFDASKWKWESRLDKAHEVKAQIDAGERIGDIDVVCQLLGIEPMADTLRSWIDPFDEVFASGPKRRPGLGEG